MVVKVLPAKVILLSSVISRLESEPFVIVSPVVAGVDVEQPKVTFTVPSLV